MRLAPDLMKLKRLHRTISPEDGWVVVVAVVVMTLMLGLGLALLKIVDTQAKQSGNERINESAFNLAEGLLTMQASVLQHNWPRQGPCTGNLSGCALAAGTNACTQANSGGFPHQCPTPSQIQTAFANVDTQGNPVTWDIQVRDDKNCTGIANPIYYSGGGSANCSSQNPGGVDCAAVLQPFATGATVPDSCKYDNNGGTANRRLWVRVDATVGPKTRSLVALLQLERLSLPFTPSAVTAGAVNFSNAGNKTIVDAGTSSITVRCNAVPSTTLTSNIAANGTAVTVDDNVPAHFSAGQQYVIQGNNPETVTVGTVGPVVTVNGGPDTSLVLNPPAQLPHSAGDAFMLAPGSNNSCENWLNGVQLTPQFHYVENPTAPDGLSATDLAILESGGAVYDGVCPANTVAALTGGIIIKNAPAAGCSISAPSGAVFNSSTVPGFIIVEGQNGGTAPVLNIPNNTTYYGVVYVANPGASAGSPTFTYFDPVLSIGSNVQICGGVVVDGLSKVQIGQANNGNSAIFCNGHQTGASIIFDPQAFKAFGAAGAAGLVQNTWRELVPGQ